LLSAGLAALALGISAIDAEQWARSLAAPSVWPLLLVAVVLLGVFWRLEGRAPAPLIDPSVLGNRQLGIANALSAISGLVEAGIVFVPSLIVTAFAVEPSAASFLLLPAVLAMAVGAPVTGRMLDRHGSRLVVLGGSAVLGVGLALVRWTTASLPAFIANGIVIGVGLSSLIGAPLRYIVLNEADEEYRAAAQAVTTLFRSIGRMVGGVLLGAVIASHAGGSLAGYHTAFLLLAAVVIAGWILALGLKGREAERRTAQQGRAPAQRAAGGGPQHRSLIRR
ncbi:MAG TPA: MFS transporter, partial [Bacillota bacterium]